MIRKMDMHVFAQRLRESRERQGLSQTELAARSGLNLGNVNELEHERKPSVRADTLVALADTLEVSMDYLAGLTEDPRPRRRLPQSVG
jgi:transcriptional regulator with XRE-family HTH domain